MLLGGVGSWKLEIGRGGGVGGVGTFRAQVLGFRRMAALIGREDGFLESERVQPLGDLARVVLLEEMVRGVRGVGGVWRGGGAGGVY